MVKSSPSDLSEEVSYEEVDLSEIDSNPTTIVSTPTGDRPLFSEKATESEVGAGTGGVFSGGPTVEDEGEGKLEVVARVRRVDAAFMDDYCLGWINGGRDDKICLRPSSGREGGCHYQSHSNKFKAEIGSFLITFRAGRTGLCALSEPTLTEDRLVGSDSIDDLLSTSYPLPVLVKFFNDRLEADDPKSPTATILKSLKKVHFSHKKIQTPFAVESKIENLRHAFDVDSVQTKLKFEDKRATEEDTLEITTVQGLVEAMDDDTVRDVLLILVKVLSQNASHIEHLKKSTRQTRKHSVDLIDRLEEIFLYSQVIGQQLGKKPLGDTELVGTTIWKSLSRLSEELEAGKDQFDILSGIVADLRSRSEVNNKNIQTMATKMKQTIPNLQSRMKTQETRRDSEGSGLSSNVDRSELRGLFDKIAVLEGEQRELASLVSMYPRGLDERLASVEEKMAEISDAADASGLYVFGDWRFQSAVDVERFLGDELQDVSIADFPELFRLLCQVSDKFTDGKTYADKSRSSQSIESTNAEVDVMATMSHPLPLVLFGKTEGKATLMDPEKGFGYQLDTYPKFSGRQSAFRQVITRKTNDLLLTIRGNLKATGRASDLAKHLCSETRNQLAEVLALLSDWHDELTNQCDYTSKVAWEFEGFVIRAVMEHLAPPRMEVASVSGLSSSRSKSLIIWAVLQVHARLISLIEAKFKSHAVVTTAMSHFIMKTRVDRSHVVDVGEKLKESLKDKTALEKRIASLESELKTFKQATGNKLSTLEKKK